MSSENVPKFPSTWGVLLLSNFTCVHKPSRAARSHYTHAHMHTDADVDSIK